MTEEERIERIVEAMTAFSVALVEAGYDPRRVYDSLGRLVYDLDPEAAVTWAIATLKREHGKADRN